MEYWQATIPYAIYDGGHGTGAKLLGTVMAATATEAADLMYSVIGLKKGQVGPPEPLLVRVMTREWYNDPDDQGIAWAEKQPLRHNQQYRYSKEICEEVQEAYNDGQYICPNCVKDLHHSLRWKKPTAYYGRHVGNNTIRKLVPLSDRGLAYTCGTCLLSWSANTLDKINESVER